MRMCGIFLAIFLCALIGMGQTIYIEDPEPRDVWGGQRFLAAKLYVNNSARGAELKLKSITVRNGAARSPLSGDFVAKIEVVQPTDGKVLASVSRGDVLKRNFTDSGVTLSFSPEHVTPPYAETVLEVWISLIPSTSSLPLPPGRQIILFFSDPRASDPGIVIGVSHQSTRSAFTVGDPHPGLEYPEPLRLEEAAVFGGQPFVALRVRLADADPNPYPVLLRSVQIRNVADPRTILAETYVKGIEIRYAGDGKILGKTTSISGLNAGGISIPLGGTGVTETDLTVPDDDERTLEIVVTLDTKVPGERKVQLECVVYHLEGGLLYPQRLDWISGPTFTTQAAGGLVGTDITGRGSWIFVGATSLVQKIKLEPRYPNDPNDSTLTTVVIKNVSMDSPLTDAHVSKIEVRTEEGSLVGSTTTVSGLRTTGVNIPCNFLVKAGRTETLEIYFTLKSDVPAGRKLRIETEIKHRAAGYELTTGPVRSTVEFTTAVNYPHIVDFTFSPATPRWDEAVTFTPNVTDDPRDPVGRDPIVYSRWEFGDGNVVERNGPPETVRYTYNKGGKFTVTLLVRDDKGLEAKKSKEISLSNQAPQGVDFDWNPKAPKWSDTITFTPSRNIRDPDGDINRATFRWNLGDGTVQETRGPQEIRHMYGKGGDFTVTLTVIDAGGAEASKSYKITVNNLPPTGVDFSVSPEAPRWNEPVTFTPARGISDPDGDISKATFAWDFGDGNTTQTTGPLEVRHTYAKGGEYTVTLTVTDQGGASEKKTKKIMVGWPTVSFTWTPTEPKAGEEVTFRASPEPDTYGFGYRWDFDDGTIFPPADKPPATTNLATHTFTLPETVTEKTFTVKLTVTLGETVIGTAENKVKVIRVINKPPTVTALRMDPAMPKPGEEITFTATASDPDGDAIVEWQWDLGDGTTRTTTVGTLKHKYDKAGAYTVKVRAKDAGSGTYGEWRSLSFYVGTQPIGVNVLDNPASTTCRIQVFAPAGATKLKITVLDMAGRTVLSEKDVLGGQFTWDLKDQEGRLVPNGLYFFFVTAEFQGQTIRSEIGRILVRR